MNFNFNENGLNIELVKITEEFAAAHTEEEISAMTSDYLEAIGNKTVTLIQFEDKLIIKFKNGAAISYNYQKLNTVPYLISLEAANNIIQINNLLVMENLHKLIKQNKMEEALRILNKASDKGLKEACLLLGQSYHSGRMLHKQNNMKALEYFQKASIQGSAEAFCEIARMYFHGNGVAIDKKIGFENFLLAANMDHPDGKFYVGISFIHEGHGNNKKDIEKGLQYIQESAQQEHLGALNYLENFNRGDL